MTKIIRHLSKMGGVRSRATEELITSKYTTKICDDGKLRAPLAIPVAATTRLALRLSRQLRSSRHMPPHAHKATGEKKRRSRQHEHSA